MNIRLLSVLTFLLLTGCSATPLVGTSNAVKEIDENEAKSCTFVQSFIVKNDNPLDKNSDNDVKNIAMNRTDVLGGNAFLVKNEAFLPSPVNIGTVIELTGDAYKCP